MVATVRREFATTLVIETCRARFLEEAAERVREGDRLCEEGYTGGRKLVRAAVD